MERLPTGNVIWYVISYRDINDGWVLVFAWMLNILDWLYKRQWCDMEFDWVGIAYRDVDGGVLMWQGVLLVLNHSQGRWWWGIDVTWSLTGFELFTGQWWWGVDVTWSFTGFEFLTGTLVVGCWSDMEVDWLRIAYRDVDGGVLMWQGVLLVLKCLQGRWWWGVDVTWSLTGWELLTGMLMVRRWCNMEFYWFWIAYRDIDGGVLIWHGGWLVFNSLQGCWWWGVDVTWNLTGWELRIGM